MQQMTGSQPLTVDETSALVDQLIGIAPSLASVLGNNPVEAERLTDIASYSDVQFFRVRVIFRHPGPAFVCARTPTELTLVNDAPSIERLNRLVDLHLDDPADAAEYLRDWFRLQPHQGSWPVESPDQLEFTPSTLKLPGRQLIAEQAETLVHPMRVTGDPVDGFRAVATVMAQQTLQSRVLQVSATGTVEQISSTDLLTDVPVPYSLR